MGYYSTPSILAERTVTPLISVLLVDDEPQLLEITKFFIEKTGSDIGITSASSAKEASALLESGSFEALVCDYQMPEMDGLEFLKVLRNQGNDIPFVLFTGKGREDVAIEALNSGADFYLQKGGDPNSQFAELSSMIRTSVAARRAERDLAKNEKLFRLLAENSRDMVFRYVLLPEPHFEYASPSTTSVTGYSPEELYANPRLGIERLEDGDRQRMEEVISAEEAADKPLLMRWSTKGGKLIWVELRLVMIKDDEGKTVAIEGTAIDATNRIKAEEELRASEAHYRSIFETAGSAMAILDEDGTILLVNSVFQRLSGYHKADVEGKMKWTSLADPSEVSKLEGAYAESQKDPEAVPRGFSVRTKDKYGSDLALLVYAAPVPGTRRMIISIVDETERRRYEEAIQQSGRKIDLLARITRHDIMNQLAVLSGYLELAHEREDDPGQKALIEKARGASDSITRHLEFARDYQNAGRKRPQWIDVQAACRRSASNLELKGARLVIELEDLEVFSDPMLEKVFYNLIDNSVKHGQRTSRVVFRYSHAPDGMHLIYEDDGVGVPDADKAMIFERGVGDRDGRRGYGLYLAREILGMTGITISETGTFGEGARFEILVPRGKYRTKKDPAARGRARKGKRT